MNGNLDFVFQGLNRLWTVSVTLILNGSPQKTVQRGQTTALRRPIDIRISADYSIFEMARHWPWRRLLAHFRSKIAQWCHRTKIRTKQSLVAGASTSQLWRLDFLSPKYDNFAYWPHWPFAQTIENVLKNWVDRIGYCKASRGSHLNDVVFHSWMERFNLSNKTIFLKKYT